MESQRPFETAILKEKQEKFSNMKLSESLQWIVIYANHLACEVKLLRSYAGVYAEEVSNLLSDETLNRYTGLAFSLRFPYHNYKEVKGKEIKYPLDAVEQGFLVQSWSTLGSFLESTLQIFLSIYYHDYIKSNWNVWDEESIQQINDLLTGDFKNLLDTLVKENEKNGRKGLNNTIKKSYIKKSKEIVKQKSELPKIHRITLSDLLQFYFSEDVISKEDFSQDELEKIRDYRNSIHAFQKRDIGTWDELNEYLKLVLMLVIEIIHRLPMLPDEIPIDGEFFQEKTALLMKEQEWFKYQMMMYVDEDKLKE